MDYSNYIIPFGKYKKKPLKDVPGNYLVKLYYQKEFMSKYPEINDYIETTYRPLLPMKVSLLIDPPLYEPIPCEKHPYIDEVEAKKVLKLIRQDKRNHKKPDRTYQCEVCGYWHLTSKPLNVQDQ